MTELQRYLAEEVAEDHSDGIITRREAVRQLGLLGVSGAAATALLSAAASRAVAAPGSRGGAGGEHGRRAPGLGRSTTGGPSRRRRSSSPGPTGRCSGRGRRPRAASAARCS